MLLIEDLREDWCRGGGREDPVGDRYERRIKVIVKIQKIKVGRWVRSGRGWWDRGVGVG